MIQRFSHHPAVSCHQNWHYSLIMQEWISWMHSYSRFLLLSHFNSSWCMLSRGGTRTQLTQKHILLSAFTLIPGAGEVDVVILFIIRVLETWMGMNAASYVADWLCEERTYATYCILSIIWMNTYLLDKFIFHHIIIGIQILNYYLLTSVCIYLL